MISKIFFPHVKYVNYLKFILFILIFNQIEFAICKILFETYNKNIADIIVDNT